MNLHPNNAPTRIVDGHVVCEPRRPYVAIVGFGTTCIDVRMIQDDPHWEIWGLNDGYRNQCFYDAPLAYEEVDGVRSLSLDAQTARLRVDRWWELHPMRVQPKDDVTWLSQCPVPVYLLRDVDREQSATVRQWPDSPAYAPETIPAIPNAVTYPLAQIESLLKLPAPFWASTFAYQIAFAIHEGFEAIGLFGLDFGSAREWLFERGNAQWWAGYAAGKGINLMIPNRSTFLRHGARYGFEYDEEVAWCNRFRDRLFASWRLAPVAED